MVRIPLTDFTMQDLENLGIDARTLESASYDSTNYHTIELPEHLNYRHSLVVSGASLHHVYFGNTLVMCGYEKHKYGYTAISVSTITANIQTVKQDIAHTIEAIKKFNTTKVHPAFFPAPNKVENVPFEQYQRMEDNSHPASQEFARNSYLR
jgi:hypothetical protein